MKRTIALLLTMALLFTLAACGSGKTDTPATTDAAGNETIGGKITYLTNRTDLDADGTYAELIARFNEKYPDVEVEVQATTDYAGELATRLQTTEYGDVLMIPDAVPTSAFSNYFLSFGTPEELSDKYQEGYLYSKYFDGQVYGLAYMCTVQGIVYNKAVFAEAGITQLPTTPEEFLTCLQKIKDNTDAIPYYTNTNSGWTLDQWEDHTYGTMTGNANYKNNELITDAGAFQAGGSHYEVAKLLYDIVTRELCESDPTTCDWEASKLMLNNGQIGCMVLGSWALSQIKEAGEHGDDVAYMPFPYSVNGKQYATSGTDYCYAVNKNSSNIPAAKAFVEFMVEESGLALSQGGISLMKGDPMPDGLEAFADVEFVVNLPETEENTGMLDEMMYESGITLYDNGQRLAEVVDIARGASSQTFEGFMASLSDKWNAAIEALK